MGNQNVYFFQSFLIIHKQFNKLIMNKYIFNTLYCLFFSLALGVLAGCERKIDTDVLATSSKVAEIFIDGFASGINFQAWGKPTALSQDNETKYSGTAALKVDVPAPDDLQGNWTGGVFYTDGGRDLSGYDALTFYVKSTASTKIEVGLGSYGDAEYTATIAGVTADAGWRKIIVLIPNPAKLTAEKGLFNFSAGTNDTGGEAYTLWIDEVKYEKLGTLAHTRIKDTTIAGFPTGNIEIDELTAYVNLPNGVNQEMIVSSKYFTFDSSNPEVATVEENMISFHGAKDRTVLTPREAEGSITITGVYDFAPVPDKNEADVISLYCDNYTNTLTSPFNGYWAPYQTTTNDEITLSDSHHIMHYGSFNFVGIVLDQDADTTGKTNVHLDILLQDYVDGNPQIDISADINADGEHAGQVTANLITGEWISVDVPLNGNTVIHQLQLAVTASSVAYQNILVDNIYFY